VIVRGRPLTDGDIAPPPVHLHTAVLLGLATSAVHGESRLFLIIPIIAAGIAVIMATIHAVDELPPTAIALDEPLVNVIVTIANDILP